MRNAKAIFGNSNREVFDLFGVSPAVRAGPFIFISGVLGLDANGVAFKDPSDEYHAAFRTIVDLLAAEGATTADIVALDSFHVTDDLMADSQIFTQVKAQYMSAPHPACTGIGVASLGAPGARAEIRVTAYLGDNGTG